MSCFRKLVPFAMCLILSASLYAAERELLPSEVTVLINHAVRANPETERTALTTPIVARMRTENLGETERFMKGEVHFLHFQPQESRDEFWPFRDRDDDLGRVANQRLMIIRINAFRMIDDLVNNDIPNYRRRFGPRADDRFGITFPVTRTAQQLAERGDADAALDLVVEEVRVHDRFDSAYTAYSLPGQFMQLAIDEGRGDEFLKLNTWVIDGLNEAIDTRLKVRNHDAGQPLDLPGIVFSSLFDDRQHGYHDWTAKLMQLRDRIADRSGYRRGEN